MVNLTKLESFLKGWKVPNKKRPILTWNKKATKAEQEKFSLTTNDRIQMYFNMEEAKLGYSIKEVLSEKDLEDNNYYIINKNKAEELKYYMEYIPEFDMVIIGQAILDCRKITNSNKDTPRFWKSCHEIFITRDKKVIYRPYHWAYCNGSYGWVPVLGLTQYDKINIYSPFKIDQILYTDCSVDGENFTEMSKPLLEIFSKYSNVGANHMLDITSGSCCLKEFLDYKEPTKKTGPKQKKIDECIKLPLPEIEYKDTYSDKMAFIQKVKPGMCVLRTMFVDHKSKEMVDAARIYVTKKEAISCRPDNFGNWVNMVLNSQGCNWDFTLYDFAKEDVEGTTLEYFGSIVKDVPDESKGKLIWGMLTCPLLEQLAKIGLKEFVIDGMVSYQKPLEPFEAILGKINDKKKSLTDKLGVNKYQLKRVCEVLQDEISKSKRRENKHFYYYSNIFNPLIYIKRVISDTYVYTNSYYHESEVFENISYLDNETFETLLSTFKDVQQIIEKMSDSYYRYNELNEYVGVVSQVRKIYGQATMLNMLEPLKLLINKNLPYKTHWGTSEQSAFRSYRDYLNMVQELNDITHFRPNFNCDDLTSITLMHDAAVSVYNLKKDEIQAKEFKNISETWNKWLYENGSYAVIAPETPNDIAQEGITLHHCVKSYISKVMARTTNILFIRKKEALDTPFFTVEVTNDSAIQQIHGTCNRNINTEPGLEDFVKEWKKARKMKLTNFNKIR